MSLTDGNDSSTVAADDQQNTNTASTETVALRSENKLKGAWWYLRHPWARVSTAIAIFFLDFWYYSEDPVAHSQVEVWIPVVGDAVSMLLLRWPSTAGLILLKVCMSIGLVVSGCVVGRQLVHHWLLRDKMRVNMFEANNGSWTVMALSTVMLLWVGGYIYNAMVGESEPQVTSSLHIESHSFAVIAQTGTWLGDLFTLLMVVDSMLQDTLCYPQWATCFKLKWAEIRIWGCWCLLLIPTAVCVTLLVLEDMADQEQNNDVSMGSGEATRCLIASLIVLCDLSILIQDWEFPTFDSSMQAEIKIPGLSVTEVDFEALGCFKCTAWYQRLKESQAFHVQVSGKWVAYGPLMVILLLDLNCMRTQMSYTPIAYGQYSDPTSNIWTVIDDSLIAAAYTNAAPQSWADNVIHWQHRKGSTDLSYAASLHDIKLNSLYKEHSSVLKAAALFPGLVSIPAAFALFWYYNEAAQVRQAKVKLRFNKMRSLLGTFSRKVHPVSDQAPAPEQSCHTPPKVDQEHLEDRAQVVVKALCADSEAARWSVGSGAVRMLSTESSSELRAQVQRAFDGLVAGGNHFKVRQLGALCESLGIMYSDRKLDQLECFLAPEGSNGMIGIETYLSWLTKRDQKKRQKRIHLALLGSLLEYKIVGRVQGEHIYWLSHDLCCLLKAELGPEIVESRVSLFAQHTFTVDQFLNWFETTFPEAAKKKRQYRPMDQNSQ